jgi:stearoyl-CoA desaturase (delta-9 desaturase)
MTTRSAPKPLISHRRGTGEMIVLKTFLLVPFAALLIAVPLVWGWGMSWIDLILAAVFYVFATLGVTVGFHR